jgi:glycerol kinase
VSAPYVPPEYVLTWKSPRWHSHDATEIQEHAEKCIAAAVKEMVEAGWTEDSVKVIGVSPPPSHQRAI